MEHEEDLINNQNERNEKITPNMDDVSERKESTEDVLNRLSQQADLENEKLKQEDQKVEGINNSIGLSYEDFEAEKLAINLDSEINSINSEAKKITDDLKKDLSIIDVSGKKDSNENIGFIVEKAKEEKFNLLKSEFEKFYKEKTKQEYSLDELKKEFTSIASNMKAVNQKLEDLPKDVIEQMKTGNYNIGVNAIREWQKAVGGQVVKISNERIPIYKKGSSESTETAAINSTEYLATIANAARFVPKEVSQKFVLDALKNFTDQDRRKSTGARFFLANAESVKQRDNIVRNLSESGYSDELKNFLSSQVMTNQMNPGNIFLYAKQGLFSEEEVKSILDQAGALEEPLKDEVNSNWG